MRFGSHTFVPTSWMCKKQTAVSHSSTESEIISLDAGLRLDGLPALEVWDFCFRLWKHDSDYRENGAIDSVLSNVPILASRSFIVCFRRKESNNETCFQDSQSCT